MNTQNEARVHLVLTHKCVSVLLGSRAPKGQLGRWSVRPPFPGGAAPGPPTCTSSPGLRSVILAPVWVLSTDGPVPA